MAVQSRNKRRQDLSFSAAFLNAAPVGNNVLLRAAVSIPVWFTFGKLVPAVASAS